jgi:hypothetical protein
MMKKKHSIIFSIIVISIFLCNGSFAQDIPVSSDLDPYREWSTPTDIERIKDQWLLHADLIIATLPTYQKELIEDAKLKLLIKERLNSLQSIKVYFAKDGVTFDAIKAFYTNQVGNTLQVLEDLEEVADNRNITDRQEKLQLALNKIPTTLLDDTNRTKLENYIQSGDLKGLTGTSTSGYSNISIQPIYVDPESYEVRDDKTAWVIISTYSQVFAPPPLQPSP